MNFAYGFGFLNEDEGQGETRYLDLQTSIYSRKVVLDIFGQFYKGMYLENSASYDYAGSGPFYLRPDIYEQILGFTAFYLFNHDRYTFRAALVQNERQLKSAGSFLLGMEFYSTRVQSVFGIGIVRLNYAKRFGTPQKWQKVAVKIPGLSIELYIFSQFTIY